MEFEWDDTKAASNLRDHGVSFAQATGAYRERCSPRAGDHPSTGSIRET